MVSEATYRGYLLEVLIAAYEVTGDPKYVEPIRQEYELAAKYGNVPATKTATRMEIAAEWRPKRSEAIAAGLTPGTEEWVGKTLAGGQKIGETVIDRIESPNDLEPRIQAASIAWQPSAGMDEVFVVVDPDDALPNEITTFNNRTSRRVAELTNRNARS